MTFRKFLLRGVVLTWLIGGSWLSCQPALADSDFRHWVTDFYDTAAKSGISSSTYELAFSGVTDPDDEVLRKAAYQPEFTTEIWDYLDARVTPRSVAAGLLMAKIHRPTLEDIEQRFNINRNYLLAIWSMESNYGAIFSRPERLHYVPRALATLAWGDSRRSKFARTQLIAALEILQAGDVDKDQLIGSWAGAMGHTQFIPTSYLAYAVDMDENGRRDIWNSVPDALATAANLLAKNGWRPSKAWGFEIFVPNGGQQYEGQTKLLRQWEELGFIRPGRQTFPLPEEKAVLKLPAGNGGPGFLMLRNFFVLKRYNNSDAYALAVGLLADRLTGKSGMVQAWPRPAGSLSLAEKIELQELLKIKGFYTGEIDGKLGTGSRKAIKQYQAKNGLVVDGVPSQKVLEAIKR